MNTDTSSVAVRFLMNEFLFLAIIIIYLAIR